ncbi:hypothetical protein BDW66DRAFT_146128 [Aspergillus desertorum]
MARGPRTGNYLFFSTTDDQPAEWISLLKGVRTLSCLDEQRPHTSHKRAEPQESNHIKEFAHRAPGLQLYSYDPFAIRLSPSFSNAIQSLTNLISTHCATDSLKEKYLATLSFIHRFFIDLDFSTCIPTSSSTSEPFSGSTLPTFSADSYLKLTFIIRT